MDIRILILVVALALCLQIGAVSASEISFEDADTIWNPTTAYSSGLTNVTGKVTTRILTEYANTVYQNSLNRSTDLVNVTSNVTPRILAEYANSIYRDDLTDIPVDLADLVNEVPSKIIIKSAKSNYYEKLIFPKELIKDTTPPVITNITVTNITGNSATITWDTDEFADSLVKYGTVSENYTYSKSNSLFVKNHSIELTSLTSGATYFFVVNSTDRSGNSAESLEDCIPKQIGTVTVDDVHGTVDYTTQIRNWRNPTKYNAPVFRRGMDYPIFILRLNDSVPANYKGLFEIYSPNQLPPIASHYSGNCPCPNINELGCIWDWTDDVTGYALDASLLPIGIYTVKGYLVNVNDQSDKIYVGSNVFYVIFDFAKESFVTWNTEPHYINIILLSYSPRIYHVNSDKPEMWKTVIEHASGAKTREEAVERVSELARRIDGNMVYHHSSDYHEAGISTLMCNIPSAFIVDEYDNDFDEVTDEEDEAWQRNYYPSGKGKAYYKKFEWHWGIPPVTTVKWVDGEGTEFDTPDRADKIAFYHDTIEMHKKDFDPENKILRQHSLGVCLDYAMLTVGYLRGIGIESRAVSGWGVRLTKCDDPEWPGPFKEVGHGWIQWHKNGEWHHLDPDGITTNSVWEKNKYNPGYYRAKGIVWRQMLVRNSDDIYDFSNIAGQYNSYSPVIYSTRILESSEHEIATICSYEIVNAPTFKPGESSIIKLNITNPTNEDKAIIVVVELIPSGHYLVPPLAYAEADKEITIAANSTITEDFNLEVVGFTSPGDYNLTAYEVVNDNATLALTIATKVLAKYTVTTEIPDETIYNQPFTFNVTIKNIETAPIYNISAELNTHYYFNTTEPLEKEIPVLNTGESHTFTWVLTPIDYGDLRIDVSVYTSDAGSEGRMVDVPVLSTPKLWITAQVPEKVRKGEDFILNATVFNSGDIPSKNVILNITTPENVTANRTSAELGIIGAHEYKTCSFRIFQNESRDFLMILNATSSDATAINYAFIEIIAEKAIFDTGTPANPYPSIPGTHNGTIKPNQTVKVSELYTYPCLGTGGHTEYAKIWNDSDWNVTASWQGYKDDWRNISFDSNFTLEAGENYSYTLITGSYPQIHHTAKLSTSTGVITCSKFVDTNGKRYDRGIPAIRLWA